VTVSALSWLGIVSSDVNRDRDFFTGAMGLTCELETESFVLLKAANGDMIELFHDTDPTYAHFTTGAVPGLEVEDLEPALAQAVAAGAAVIGAVLTGSLGNRWVHLRAPNGMILELLQRADRPA
jgi:predicted enzyme related to lactoylglutathione lyase